MCAPAPLEWWMHHAQPFVLLACPKVQAAGQPGRDQQQGVLCLLQYWLVLLCTVSSSLCIICWWRRNLECTKWFSWCHSCCPNSKQRCAQTWLEPVILCVSICSRLVSVGTTRDVAVNSALIDCLATQQASCSYQPFIRSRLLQVSRDTPVA